MDVISPSVQSVVDLFSNELAEVRFPGVDAESLTRTANEVAAAAAALTAAQEALVKARDALQAKQEGLLQQVQRAVAYARVFAENDPALAAKVDAIAVPRPGRKPRSANEGPQSPTTSASGAGPSTEAEVAPAPKPRGRPRKVRPEAEQEPVEEAAPPVQN